MTVKHSLRQSSCLKQRETKQHRVSHYAPYRSDHIIRKRNSLHHDFAILMAVYPVSWILTGSMVLTAYWLCSRLPNVENGIGARLTIR